MTASVYNNLTPNITATNVSLNILDSNLTFSVTLPSSGRYSVVDMATNGSVVNLKQSNGMTAVYGTTIFTSDSMVYYLVGDIITFGVTVVTSNVNVTFKLSYNDSSPWLNFTLCDETLVLTKNFTYPGVFKVTVVAMGTFARVMSPAYLQLNITSTSFFSINLTLVFYKIQLPFFKKDPTTTTTTTTTTTGNMTTSTLAPSVEAPVAESVIPASPAQIASTLTNLASLSSGKNF
jgi:hypothetical protein